MIKVKEVEMELGKRYKLVWKGIYGGKHNYVGKLTKIDKELTFNDDLIVEPKEIVKIERTKEKITDLSGLTKQDIREKNKKEEWYDGFLG